MTKWWPIPSSKCRERIEWSLRAGKNLRVQLVNGFWVHSKCKYAKNAQSIGERLIEKNKDYLGDPEIIILEFANDNEFKKVLQEIYENKAIHGLISENDYLGNNSIRIKNKYLEILNLSGIQYSKKTPGDET